MHANSEDVKTKGGDATPSQVLGESDAPRPPDEPGYMGPIERANLASLLGGIGQRLSDLEDRLKNAPSEGSKSTVWLEFSKIIFGGWPAFGLVLLVVFYQPIHDAINTIPENLKRAKEIGAFGVTLTMTVQDEAKKAGQLELSKTLPTLAPSAVAYMLRGSAEYNNLEKLIRVKDKVAIAWLPNDSVLKILEELEEKKLITIKVDSADKDVAYLRKSIQEFKKANPSKNHELTPEWEYWEFAEPVTDVPAYGWRFTELGKTAVNVIINAVSSQLAAGASGPKDRQ